ncbi:MAG: glycosyltransferase family 4 protein, partial [Rhodothermales bacterium]|nr:glycosyltransferase family 4 protein [Rhodothermales bacterium]
IYVGAHGVANHLIQMLEAARLLIDRNDVHFVLVGTGMQKEWLQEKAHELQLNNVEFVDPVSKDEVFKYIAAADIGASVLKKVDAFKTVYSNKTFDYMACSRPVLMAIDGVSRQLVVDAECGAYVEPENPNDFAEKVAAYADMDVDIRLKQGQAGHAYARAHFDRDMLAERYVKHLQAIAS